MHRFIFKLIALAVLFQFSASTYAEGKWLKDTNGCEFWTPYPQLGKAYTWTGECVDGKVQGSGVFTYRWVSEGQELQVTIEGEMSNGYLQGFAKITESSGYRFSGEFQNSLRFGLGKVLYANGNFYIGEWQNDKFNGIGCFQAASGQTYKGKWQDNVPGRVLPPDSTEVSDLQQELETDLKQAETFKEYVDKECLLHRSCPDVKKFAAEQVESSKAALQRITAN